MISIVTDLSGIQRLKVKISKIKDPDQVMRLIASTLSAEVHERIHEKGLDSKEQPIGSYNEKYFKKTRPKFNREEPQNKVVFSLTRKMENSFTFGSNNKEPFKTEKGYALGFIGGPNSGTTYKDLSEHLEERFKVSVYKTTDRERQMAVDIALDFTNQTMNSQI